MCGVCFRLNLGFLSYASCAGSAALNLLFSPTVKYLTQHLNTGFPAGQSFAMLLVYAQNICKLYLKGEC